MAYTAEQLEAYWKKNSGMFQQAIKTDQFKKALERQFQANPLQVFSAGVRDINEGYQQELDALARSGKYDRQSEIRQAGSGLRVDATNEVKGLMQDLGLSEKDLRQNVKGSGNDLFMDLGVGNLAVHDVGVGGIDVGTGTQLPNYRDIAAQGGELQTTSDQLGNFTLTEKVDKELDKQALGIMASLAVPYAVGPGGLGLTGIYGGAGAAAAGTAAQQAIQGDIDVGEIFKSGALGGLTAVGTDLIKDAVSKAVDPATGLRATTSDLGGLVGEKGLLSGIPELNVEGLRDFTSGAGDFLFGPSANTEWATLADGTRLTPDAQGFIALPDGSQMHMLEAMQTPEIATYLQEAGTGGVLSAFNPALDFFNTAFTPVADDLASFIVGDNPWHDERLTLDERLNAQRSPDASSRSIYRDLPKGMTGGYAPPSEEEQQASEPLVVGPQPSQEEAEQFVEDIVEGDDDLIFGGTASGTETGGGEQTVQEETPPNLGGTTGGDTMPDGGDDEFPPGGDYFPTITFKTDYDIPEDEVGRTQDIPPGGGGGGGSDVAAERARRKLKEGDPELFRLARIMQVEGLPQSVYEAAIGRINGILKGREGSDYEGDVTRGVDPLSGRYVQRVKGERGASRRKTMLRELKEKEMTT